MALPAGNQSFEIMIDSLTNRLWHLCAGPLVTLPKKNELVYYFPEGHLEHLQAFIDPIPVQNLPPFNLPSKILCKVDSIFLMANPETDEVFSTINLTPTTDVKAPTRLPEPKEKCKFVSFCKALTVSDTNNSFGSLIVRQNDANNCFPVLDMSKENPSQELVATDLHNIEWRFKHSYKGEPKRHFLSNGWSEFVSSKKLKEGDVIIFIKEQNGDLRVGVRRVKSQQFNDPEILSPEGMHTGLLATAAHALMNIKSSFSVFYMPRTMRPNFVVSMEKYLMARIREIDVGMRFTMEFEGTNGLETRYSGIVVGVGANESQVWRNSEWKSLKVKWDRLFPFWPDRVSTWEIKPLGAPSQSYFQAPQSNKRPRDPAPSNGLQRFFAKSPFDESLFSSPYEKTTSLDYGGIDTFMGGIRGFSFCPNHSFGGAGPSSQLSSTQKKSAYGNSVRLFGCELVQERPKKPEEEKEGE